MKRTSTEHGEIKVQKKKLKYLSENKLKEITSIFLNDKKHANILIDLLNQFQKPAETPPACVSAVENIFVEVLKRRDMTVSETENLSEAELQYKEWLSGCYEEVWGKLASCLQKGTPECKVQSLNSLFKLMSAEAKNPLNIGKKKKKHKNSFPVNRLKEILNSLYLSSKMNEEVLKRMSELVNYRDVYCNIWLALERLLKETCRQQPTDRSVWNILLVLSRLPKSKRESDVVLCDVKSGVPDDRVVKAAIDNVWKLLAPWLYSTNTQQLLLIVLIEHMMPQMDNAIFLTDYFMDALERDECEVQMVALQGIFNLVIKHNIEYPNIFGKLYQLFTVKVFKAKYKTRLFVLTDEFLRSTHLPLALVAAFAKRFSRLLLVASPPDSLILLSLTANLLIRHPDLKFIYHNPEAKEVSDDPYLENEKDPLKSKATESQLWEVKLFQHHHVNRVAKMANFINNDLPSVEFQLEPLLDLTWQEMVKKDVKLLVKKIPQVTEKFQGKPLSSKMGEARKKELSLLLSDFANFVC